jgi:hypothetical protein
MSNRPRIPAASSRRYYAALAHDIASEGEIHPCDNLIMAVIAQAAQDLTNKYWRDDARWWLLGTGREWLDAMGLEAEKYLEKV